MATVDANHLASDDSAIEAWIDRTGIRHVKVRPLIFREVKEGGRIISGDRPRPHQHTPTTDKTSRRQPGPEEAKTWARDFRRQRARADASATLPPEIRDEVAAHLRSAAPDQTAISAY